MKKQLAILHTTLVSIATKQFISILKQNSCYDIMADSAVYRLLPSLSYLCNVMPQNPYSFLNCFMPLRVHPITRDTINRIISKHRKALSSGKIQSTIHTDAAGDSDPEEDSYYYGILFMDETVVSIFKSNKNIGVTPADINAIMNFMKTNQSSLRKLQPCFEELCLPGMTEEYKLPLFFKYNEPKVKVG